MNLSGRRGFKKHDIWQNIVTPTCWETKNRSDCVTTVFRAKMIDADTVGLSDLHCEHDRSSAYLQAITSDTYIVPQKSLKPAQGTLSSVSNTNALGSRKQDNSSDDSKPKKRPRSSRLDPSRAFAYGPKVCQRRAEDVLRKQWYELTCSAKKARLDANVVVSVCHRAVTTTGKISYCECPYESMSADETG